MVATKQDAFAVPQHSGHGQKSGVPGRNVGEPETDLFSVVEIMLDMPEHPTWREVSIKLARALAVLTVGYFLLMALYFGAEFQSEHQMKNFDIMVVNLDQGMIGLHYDNFVQTLNKQPGQPNWSVQSPTLYANLSAIQEQVRTGRFWGAVVVQSNASLNLNQAYSTQFKNYDPSGAFAFIYDSGRDPLVVRPRIVAAMYLQFLEFSRRFNPAWVRFVLNFSEAQATFNVSSLVRSPQVLGTPIAFEEYDLHPVTAAIITSATSVAYIWIFLVAGGSTYLVAHVIQPMTRGASVGKTMAMLLTPLLAFVMVLSMTYSILLLAFGVPFANGVPQFLSLFAGMLLLQCAVASLVLFLIYLIPVVFIPTFTITFVILNVIAVFNPGELVPSFYRWVYAMPFLNAVQISRYVLMGSYNRLQYNVPILAAWTLTPLVLLPFAIHRQKRMARALEDHEELREEEEKEDRRPSGKTAALQQKGQPKRDSEKIRRHPSRKERYGRPSRDGTEHDSPWSGKSGESDWEDDVIRLSGELYRLENHPPAERRPSRSRRGDQRAHARQEQPRVSSRSSTRAQTSPAPLKSSGHKSRASASAPSESRVFGRASAHRSRAYDKRRHDERAANMIPNEVKV
ncbi:hypothetical protein BGZ70_005745 [Mortierella alpina]|uniref:DUF3533 domain-containing protein n=1 Tax=Mortierella alpina TaxID=64518 RepID=A0A9P6J8M0_MORAP|nr:hypothetical protein BGZ70_005745 [Mortierella alpina]